MCIRDRVSFVQGFTHIVALCRDKGVSDTTANDQLVSDFRQGVQNGQFGMESFYTQAAKEISLAEAPKFAEAIINNQIQGRTLVKVN